MKANLHLASSMEELNKKIQLNVSSSKVKILLNSLPKLFSAAEEKRQEGDEEAAYVLYMKFIGVVQAIMGKAEYKEDKKYFDAMIDLAKLKKAMSFSETLSQSLSERYKEKNLATKKDREKQEEQELVARMALVKLNAPKIKDGGDVVAAPKSNGDQGYSLMEPKVLHSLIAEKSTSFLLLDVRPSSDYEATHIKHPNSLNIPEEILIAGSTSKALERTMPIHSRAQWHRRATTDKIILLDWTSKAIKPRSPLECLRDAMYKWEPGEYLCKMPHVLLGGFENFSIRYPNEVTDHNKARSLAKSRLSNMAGKPVVPNLAQVNYPDPSFLDDTLIPPAPTTAVAKDESIIDSDVEEEISKRPPTVPDRRAKPTLQSRKIDDVALASQVVPVNDSSTLESTTDLESSKIQQPPIIDRSLKAKVLLAKGNSNGKMKEVLEAEKDLAEDSLRLEQQQLEMEQQWILLRLKREKEAEEEMKEEMMKSEEVLLEKISSLVEEKSQRDHENEDLRRQLNNLKAQLKSKSDIEEEKVERGVAERVRQQDQERQRLQAEVEEKRRERKLKQREQLVEAHKKQQQQQEREERERQVVEAENKRNQLNRGVRANGEVIRMPLRDDSATSNFGNLSRSHSSPNIAQMLEEEDQALNVPAPRFDRNIKPSPANFNHASRGARNFQPVWGTAKKGLTGLKNLGNTCYMNSILQCLSNFTIPAQYFIDMTFKRDLNNNSETKGEVAIEFSEVIRALWCGQYKSIAPTDLKRIVGRYMDAFKGSSQQDAHEFLTKLMDWLNDDLNEVRKKVTLPPEIDYKGMDERAAAEAAWEMQKRVEKSFIQETFFGQTRSTCACRSCGFRSYKFEKFLGLTLTLPMGGGKWNLHQCIQDLLREEEVDYVCEKCKRSKKATKKLEIVRLPLILTVHLKRFYRDYEIDVWRKRPNYVDFELTDFNMGHYATACRGELNRYRNYQLYGVCNHFGSMEGGHYTAYCYSQVYGKWYKYDDHEVTSMSASDVKTSAAYILFYSAMN